MEYTDPVTGTKLAGRTRDFIEDVVLPYEREHPASGSIDPETLEGLRAEARDRDIYAPCAPERYGGLGLDLRTAVPVFEAAGRSLLGPHTLRINSPDQGNVYLLDQLGTREQRDRWLEPIVAGDVDTGFSITEPTPGCGSDVSMMKTTAERRSDGWVIEGHKWWTTGGTRADLLFVVARTDPDTEPPDGYTIFLVPTDTDGVSVVREIPSTVRTGYGAHAELLFEDVSVPASAVLGEVNEGMEYLGIRSSASRPGRCMRQIGIASRAFDIAVAYTSERESGGEPLSQKQAIRFELAEAATRLHVARTLVRDTVDRIVSGDGDATTSLHMTRLFVTDQVQRVVETAVQACGANGVGKDLPLSDFYEYVRPTSSSLASVGNKRRIAATLFQDVDHDELVPLSRFDSPSTRRR